MAEKKRTEPDVPRRIWYETVDRINKHLEKTEKKVVGRKKKLIIQKESFNEFLARAIDAYELTHESELVYANKLYKDLAEARGEAIVDAVRRGVVPEMPSKVVVLGKDKL